jgi:hypothetical protein
MKHEVHTISGIKAALDSVDVSDDQFVMAQVVGANGSAWNMQIAIHVDETGKGRFPLTLVLEHPDLKTLPAIPETNT